MSHYTTVIATIHPFSKTDLVATPTREGQLPRLDYKMPDTFGLGHRPVVRKLSATSNDLFKKFGERRDSTDSSSNLGLGSSGSASTSGTTTPSLLRSRPGSVKKIRSKAEVSF